MLSSDAIGLRYCKQRAPMDLTEVYFEVVNEGVDVYTRSVIKFNLIDLLGTLGEAFMF